MLEPEFQQAFPTYSPSLILSLYPASRMTQELGIRTRQQFPNASHIKNHDVHSKHCAIISQSHMVSLVMSLSTSDDQ